MLAESVPLCQIRPVRSVVECGENYRLCNGYLQAVIVMSLDEITYKGVMKEKHQETVVYNEIFDIRTQVSERDSTKKEMIC